MCSLICSATTASDGRYQIARYFLKGLSEVNQPVDQIVKRQPRLTDEGKVVLFSCAPIS